MIPDHNAARGTSADRSQGVTDPSRRNFLQAGAAVGGGFLLSLVLPVGADAEATDADRFAPNAFIRIGRDGRIVLVMPASMKSWLKIDAPYCRVLDGEIHNLSDFMLVHASLDG